MNPTRKSSADTKKKSEKRWSWRMHPPSCQLRNLKERMGAGGRGGVVVVVGGTDPSRTVKYICEVSSRTSVWRGANAAGASHISPGNKREERVSDTKESRGVLTFYRPDTSPARLGEEVATLPLSDAGILEDGGREGGREEKEEEEKEEEGCSSGLVMVSREGGVEVVVVLGGVAFAGFNLKKKKKKKPLKRVQSELSCLLIASLCALLHWVSWNPASSHIPHLTSRITPRRSCPRAERAAAAHPSSSRA